MHFTEDGFYKLCSFYSLFIFDIDSIISPKEQEMHKAIEVLKQLRLKGKHVALMSHSPLEIDRVRDYLNNQGISIYYYQSLITCGSYALECLKFPPDPFHRRLGKRYYFIGKTHEEEILKDLPFVQVTDLEDTDFIFVTSLEEWHDTLEVYDDILKEAAQRNLPLLCINPDLYTIQEGHLKVQGGALGKAYEDLGGKVHFYGKENPHFLKDLFLKYNSVARSEMLVIGSSVKKDTLLCQNQEIDLFLVIKELTCFEIGLEAFAPFDKVVHGLQELGYTPNYVASRLYWD
jgi:HAD superfamily hydrolase (TIGR01459 family)